MPDQVDCDMVPGRPVIGEEQPVQHRLTRKFNPSLLHQLALQRLAKAFANFDAAAGQVPAREIAVLDQKYSVVCVQHHGADPARHAAGETPVEMKHPPQLRLETLSEALEDHCRHGAEILSTPIFPSLAAPTFPSHSKPSQG